jgi:hypothetical protein
MGIDRRTWWPRTPPGSAVASHYTPCDPALPRSWYEFDLLQAKDLLATVGYADGFDT